MRRKVNSAIPWKLLRKIYLGVGGCIVFSLVSFVITKSTVNVKTWVSTRPWCMPLRVSWWNLRDTGWHHLQHAQQADQWAPWGLQFVLGGLWNSRLVASLLLQPGVSPVSTQRTQVLFSGVAPLLYFSFSSVYFSLLQFQTNQLEPGKLTFFCHYRSDTVCKRKFRKYRRYKEEIENC